MGQVLLITPDSQFYTAPHISPTRYTWHIALRNTYMIIQPRPSNFPNSSPDWDHMKMADILQTANWNALCWRKIVQGYILIQIPLKDVLNVSALVQIMAWHWWQTTTRTNDDRVMWRIHGSPGLCELTHWRRMTHICVGKLSSIGSDNGLSPGRRLAIIWTKCWNIVNWTLGNKFSEILIEIHTFSLKKIRLKMSSAKCCSFRLGLNVWTHPDQVADKLLGNLGQRV